MQRHKLRRPTNECKQPDSHWQIDQATLDRIAELVIERRAFLDTVVVWSKVRLRQSEVAKLQSLCAGESWPEYRRMAYGPAWSCRLTLQCPSNAAFEFLRDLPYEFQISRVDLALDLVTPTFRDTNLLSDFFAKHLTKLWPGKGSLGRYEDTIYSSDNKGAPNTICLYADRPSKMASVGDDAPVVHIEWRAKNADAVRRIGVHSLQDLIGYPHRQLWQDKMVLESLDFRRFGEAYFRAGHRRPRKRSPDDRGFFYDQTLRAGHHLARLAQAYVGEGGEFARPHGCPDEIKRANRWISSAALRRCIQRLDGSAFLPE